jgi:hypothetical protein
MNTSAGKAAAGVSRATLHCLQGTGLGNAGTNAAGAFDAPMLCKAEKKEISFHICVEDGTKFCQIHGILQKYL